MTPPPLKEQIAHLEILRADARDEIKKRIEQRDKFSIQLTIALSVIIEAAFSEKPCPCAKPAPGMLLEADADFHVDLTKSYMIGDKTSDVEAGRAAGCKTILVLSGKAGREEGAISVRHELIVENLPSAVKEITKDLENR